MKRLIHRLSVPMLTIATLFAAAGHVHAQRQPTLVELVAMGRVGQLVNQERTNNNLRPLTFDSRLNAAAIKYAQVMAENPTQYASHTINTSTNDIRQAIKEKMEREGYMPSVWGENIHYWDTAEHVVLDNPNGWMHFNTPGYGQVHRNTILNANATEMGVGVARAGNQAYYCLMVGHTNQPAPSSPQPAASSPPQFGSGGGGFLAAPVVVENQSRATLKYRFYVPENQWVRAHWSQIFTLRHGESRTHGCGNGETLQATEWNGRYVNRTLSVQLNRRHVATSGRVGHFNTVGWSVR